MTSPGRTTLTNALRGVWSKTDDLTFQTEDLRAVEVQQRGQGAAVCVVLQQVLHQGERWSAPLLLPPVVSLKPWQQYNGVIYTVYGHLVQMLHVPEQNDTS